jgi:cytochrome c6
MKLRFLSGGVLLAIVVIAAGCGSSGGGAGSQNAALAKLPGAHVFKTAGCTGCHTLKAANAKGQVGPNLDDLKPDKQRVVRQVDNGGGPMPAFKGKLSGTQIDAVATYVSTVAGKG